MLYIISPKNILPFLGGGFGLIILLSIFYGGKIKKNKEFGITSIIIALITYCLTPLIYTQSSWLVLLIVVSVLVLTEMKQTFLNFSEKFDEDEFITLAKFLVIAGVILPLLPDKPISTVFNISPYKFWLAIVAVSAISYFSYLLKKFVFPKTGILLTGILGGLYSSTATTVILARKSKESSAESKLAGAIMMATTMMYLRIFLLALFFNKALAYQMALPFAVLAIVSGFTGIYFSRKGTVSAAQNPGVSVEASKGNPLEFKTALLFGALFILFTFVTGFVNQHYGQTGIKILSFIVGVTDIDPFIINLFQGHWNMSLNFIVIAIINASTSNNLLKMIYGLSLGDASMRKDLIIGFGILIILGLIFSFLLL
jgi:uncharacterized membrane protein (DUF4010 family)